MQFYGLVLDLLLLGLMSASEVAGPPQVTLWASLRLRSSLHGLRGPVFRLRFRSSVGELGRRR